MLDLDRPAIRRKAADHASHFVALRGYLRGFCFLVAGGNEQRQPDEPRKCSPRESQVSETAVLQHSLNMTNEILTKLDLHQDSRSQLNPK